MGAYVVLCMTKLICKAAKNGLTKMERRMMSIRHGRMKKDKVVGSVLAGVTLLMSGTFVDRCTPGIVRWRALNSLQEA